MTRTAPALLFTAFPMLLLCSSCAHMGEEPGSISAATNTSHAGNAMSEKPSHPQSSHSEFRSPEDAERKLLSLIDSIKAPQDVTLSRFKTMMHLNEAAGFTDTGDYDFQESVAGTDWTHSLSFSSDPGGFGYRLDHPNLHSDSLDVDMSSVCGLDYDSYRRELVSMGYLEGPPTPDPINYERRGTTSHTFSRNGVVVDVLSQRERPGSAQQRSCILQIDVWAVEANHEGE